MSSQKIGVRPPIEPKSVHYFSNGSGRDHYICVDNGGHFKAKIEHNSGFEIGTFGPKRRYQPVNNYLPAKHLHYFSDGTGRDTYVIVDEGGLAASQWKRSNYIKSLRGYEKLRPVDPKDFFFRSQFCSSTKNSTKQKKLIEDQKYQTWRLSQPKVQEDPYQKIRTEAVSLPGLRKVYN